jgi:hypothetical protein
MICALSGCRSRQTASSSRTRACSSARRTCILHALRWPQGARWHGGPVVLQRRPLAARRSSRRFQKQAAELDYAPAFQMGHPKAFELAARLPPCALAAGPRLLHQFRFRKRRHRAEDRARLSAVIGQGTRTRLIGRERGYHGVNFGGISVGGIVANRKMFGTHADRRRPHAAHHDLPAQRLHRGEPEHGGEYRRELIASSSCTTPRPSPPSSSSRSPAPPAC